LGPSDAQIADSRLLFLAALTSARSAVSGRGELHDRDLALADALRLTLGSIASGVGLAPREVADRVRARFPALPPVPERPALDALLAPLGLAYDAGRKAYAPPTRPADTTGLVSRTGTYVLQAGSTPPPAATRVDARLTESMQIRSFLALGAAAAQIDRVRNLLVARHDAHVVDITDLLLEALRAQASAAGVPWDAVRAADAADPGSRDAEGLNVLVRRAMPVVESTLSETVEAVEAPGCPVLLVEAGPLARYGRLDVLAAWTDLGRRRSRAVWLLLPLLGQSSGPVLDDRPLPLASSGQYLWLAREWVDAAATVAASVPGGSQ
jgi:hypothetical protein